MRLFVVVFSLLVCVDCAVLLESGMTFYKTHGSQSHQFVHEPKPSDYFYPWKTVWFYLDTLSNDYTLRVGCDIEGTYQPFTFMSLLNTFFPQNSNYLAMNPINATCITVDTTRPNITIRIIENNFDLKKLSNVFIGIVLFMYSSVLIQNVFFFYSIGISIGIFASLLILIFFISKLFPKKPFIYGMMFSGWALTLYFLQYVWSNLRPVIYLYKEYILWYMAITGFFSFIVCYKIGPPKKPKNIAILSWIIQGISIILIYENTNFSQVTISIVILLVVFKYAPRKWINAIKVYWRRRYPPQRILLTKEQYYEQGIRETAKALEELRGYCSSPECNQWNLMLKLKNPSRFAEFVNKEDSHLSDTEIEEHEDEVFHIRRKNIGVQKNGSTQLKEEDFTDDDSSFSPDEI